jgi:membrane protease YdiL (CAAX protease family)
MPKLDAFSFQKRFPNYNMVPKSTYAKAILFLAVVAACGMAWLIANHATDAAYAFFFIMEGGFCYVSIPGIIGLDYYARTNGLSGMRGQWDPVVTGVHFLAIMITVLVVQKLITQLGSFLSVNQVELFFYYIFGAISEELFFRGFLFRIILGNKNNLLRLIAGAVISSICFAAIHIGYYASITKMAIVFASGIILCIYYWHWKDLLANVVAHAIINLIVALTLVALPFLM